MACLGQDISDKLKPINVGANVNLSPNVFLADTKEGTEHDILTGIKIEPSTLDNCDVVQKPDVMEMDTLYDILDDHGTSYIKENIRSIQTEYPIKYEPRTFNCDAKPFETALIKSKEDDVFPEFEPKYIKEEECVAFDEGSSSNCTAETDLIKGDGAGLSPSYELKSEEVDLGEVNKGEGTGRSIEMKDKDSGEQHSSRKEVRFRSGEMKKRVPTKSNLSKDMLTHGKEPKTTFECIKCQETFLCKRYLDGHIVAFHCYDSEMMKSVTQKVHCCKHCKFTTVYASNLTKHMKTHGEHIDVKFDCIKCKKEFSSKLNLDGHIVALHSSDDEVMKCVTHKIHRCNDCKYITIIRNDLAKHMPMHGKELKTTFDCIECGKEFSRKRYLDGHIIAHHRNSAEMMKSITQKVFPCKHCKYITIYSSTLAKHMRTHGEQIGVTFDCIKCKKKFPSKSGLDGHIIALHRSSDKMMNTVSSKIYQNLMKLEKSGTAFECIECNKKFWSKIGLDGHILELHGNNDELMKSITHEIYCCMHCRYITVEKSVLARHMTRHKGKLKLTSKNARRNFRATYH